LSAQQDLEVHILQGTVDEDSDLELLSFLGSSLVGQDKEIGFLVLGDSRKDKFSDEDREVSRICSAEIAVVIDNARLYEANARLYANLERELHRAHDMQLSMLPQNNPMESSLRIEAATIPAKEVGGDYYDYFSLNDHQLLLAIGDVTGKGVSAALMMATVKTALQMRLESTQNVSEIMTSLNKLVCEQAARSQQYMTLFLGIIDVQAKTLTYCNAGHNFPYRISIDTTLEQLDQSVGLPLGFQNNDPYTECVHPLHLNDILFLYTDGVVEAMNEHKELFGYPRLEELLLDYSREDPVALHLKILEHIEAFCHETPQDDDMTMLFVQCLCPS
jgi:sigma-B regulation protein RsbU (phosphoserine phosphatase)